MPGFLQYVLAVQKVIPIIPNPVPVAQSRNPESPFENAQGWLMRRRSKLPMLRWMRASETSQRSS